MDIQDFFYAISECIPHDVPDKDDVLIWTDGDEILCKTEWLAEALADIIDKLAGDSVTHTGYYDPEEDAKEPYGPFKTTGWHYISFD